MVVIPASPVCKVLLFEKKSPCRTGWKPCQTSVADDKCFQVLDAISVVHGNVEHPRNASSPRTPEYVGNIAENSCNAGVAIKDEISIYFVDEDRYDAFDSLPEHFYKS